jgi:uncharacterized protein (DUF2252 family)
MKTPIERVEYGKSRRRMVSRGAQKELRVKYRKFDPIQVLLSSTAGHRENLLPIKYFRMSHSPFAFFRGAVSIMAADLARLPYSGLLVQLCGDAHVQNMGSFASPAGNLIFDLNDFDETIRGPWEWDVKRMATSIILAGREAGQKRAVCTAAAEIFAETYCVSMDEFSRQPILQVARHCIEREKNNRTIQAVMSESKRVKPLGLLKKYTYVDGRGQVQCRHLPPNFWRVTGREAQRVLSSLTLYRERLAPERRHLFDLFRPIGVGFKVVGVGSVGLRDYVVLLEGNGPKDPLFLQIKQEVKSAYASYVSDERYKHAGRRVAEGQRSIQPQSDPLLGWTEFGGHEYLVRQLNDRKGSINLEMLKGNGLASLAMVAGELLARGHARTGDMCAIHGYCGGGPKIVKAITDFASAYADQTEIDYAEFMAAVKRKKIELVKLAKH